jgi:hypothetical protein
MEKAMSKKKYIVQVLVVREVEVEATDDLQAEKEAFAKLKDTDRNAAIALRVLEPGKPGKANKDNIGGALWSADPRDNWSYAKDNFAAFDPEWVGIAD